LEKFKFGQFNQAEGTSMWKDLRNSDVSVYGEQANTAQLTMAVRGIALPSALHAKFTNLLNLLAAGDAVWTCGTVGGEVCSSP
jgi:hypothetical protein